MKIIEPYVEILTPVDTSLLRMVERCGRVCYKSEDRITPESAEKFVANLIARGHEAVLEHASIAVKFVCDRGVSHEIVRHRIAAYCQESTRYCNYSKGDFGGEVTFIKPLFFDRGTQPYEAWEASCRTSEEAYFELLNLGCSPQEARSVLPNSLKTEVIMTANLREWRHFLKLRCSPAAHPQMRQLAVELLNKLTAAVPVVFDDIVGKKADNEQ